MLFLDEIGLMPEGVQAKLLKAMEGGAVRRLGSTRNESIDVWIIAATSENLKAAVEAHRFREDLYHRLAVVTLELPPLRDRGSDILLLADQFLVRTCRNYGERAKTVSPEARTALMRSRWTGNIRELANVMERVALLSDAVVVTPDALGFRLRRPVQHSAAVPGFPGAGAASILTTGVTPMFMLFVAAGMGLMVLAHVAPFPFLLDALTPGRSHWEMPPREGAPRVYLTYDDGPNPTATPALLDVLAREGAVATFFLLDRHLDASTAPIVARMFDEGHAVALHSHTRRLMVLSPAAFAQTLQAAADRIEQFTGDRPCRAFRPHGGWRSGQMYTGLALINHTLIGWGWWLWDWDWFREPDPGRLVRRFAGRVSGGDIIVMHDGHHEDPRADRQYAIDATVRLVPALRDQGFTFGTIC